MPTQDLPSDPFLIDGGFGVDDRGRISFVNGFGFAGVKRFYLLSNFRQGFVRAWHGHKHEAKYIFVVTGAAVVGAVKIDDWSNPDKNAKVHRQVLSADKPAIFYIPAGYANGFMSLAPETKLIFFSTASFEDTRTDDIRFPARYWDIWQVEER